MFHIFARRGLGLGSVVQVATTPLISSQQIISRPKRCSRNSRRRKGPTARQNRRHNLHRAHDPRPDRGGGLLSALKGKIDDDLLKEAYVEHDGAKQLINDILASGPDDAFSEAKVTVLSEQMSLATAPSRPNAAPSDSWRRLAPRRSRRVRASNAALRLIRSTQNAICWTCCAPATCATA